MIADEPINVELRTTWNALAEANSSFAEPVDVFRVLNCAPPRSWHVALTFDDPCSNNIVFRASPPLQRGELLPLLDGRLPALFMAAGIRVAIDGECFELDMRPEARAASPLTATFRRMCNVRLDGQLQLCRYPHIQLLHKETAFRDWAAKHTWLGSRCPEDQPHRLNVTLFGSQFTVPVFAPRDKVSHDGSPRFVQRTTLKHSGELLGELTVEFHHRGQPIVRHRRFGEFDPTHFSPDFWRSIGATKRCSVTLEIDAPPTIVSWWSGLGPQDSKQLARLLSATATAVDRVFCSPEGERFVADLERWRRKQTAEQLKDRQRKLEQRARVVISGAQLFAQPSCENELVALYMKLEAAGKLPFDCRVIEYTSRAGIDALGEFRFHDEEMWRLYAPIEFEYLVDSFLDHQHPVEQTALIICWDVDNEDLLRPTRNKARQWLRTLVSGGREIPVIVISRIPGLELE